MNRRALVGRHQRFAEEPGAEVRDDHRDGRKARGASAPRQADRRAADRRATADRASSGRRRSARRSARRPRRRVRPRRRRHALDTLVVQPVAVHRGEEATPRRFSSPSARSSRHGASAAVGLNMKKPTKRVGCRRNRGGNGLFVARDARDERRAATSVAVELGDPAIGETSARARGVPAEPARRRRRALSRGQIGDVRRQHLEESRREEVAMGVAEHVRIRRGRPIRVGLVSDTHGLAAARAVAALDGRLADSARRRRRRQPTSSPTLLAIAPVHAVCGNVTIALSPVSTALQSISIWKVCRIHVSHGHEVGSPTPARLPVALRRRHHRLRPHAQGR